MTVIPTNSITSWILGILLFSAELVGFFQFLIFQFLFLKKRNLNDQTIEMNDLKDKPSVDVLICTYNEPTDLLEKTLVAALNMNYPKEKMTVNICDDGKRDAVRDLCKKYQANWITRDHNKGAKAGNINNALSRLHGELFAVLDADMIPTKEFLSKTVGYFTEEDVAFVQCPQVYYNKDMYQYNLARNIPNEQDFFMRDIQEARASINAVLHVGTNAVFRKKHIDEIGGYPTCSITEDMAVGMLLHAKKYRSIFVNEELVYGLSAATYSDLLSQRDRWCRGNLQVASHFNLLFKKGLTFAQRIAYTDGILYWFSSIQKMIFMVMPIIYLTTGVLILNASIDDVLTFFIPFFLGQMIIFNALSPKTRSLRWAHIYEVAMAPHISMSIIKHVLHLKTAFNVTPKDVTNDKAYFQYKAVLPHCILLFMTIISWGTGLFFLLSETINIGTFLINIAWSSYNAYALVIAIYVAYQKPIPKSSERINVDKLLPVIIKTTNNEYINHCYIKDLSEKELGLVNKGDYRFKSKQNMLISFDNKTFSTGFIVNHNKHKFDFVFTDVDKNKMFSIGCVCQTFTSSL